MQKINIIMAHRIRLAAEQGLHNYGAQLTQTALGAGGAYIASQARNYYNNYNSKRSRIEEADSTTGDEAMNDAAGDLRANGNGGIAAFRGPLIGNTEENKQHARHYQEAIQLHSRKVGLLNWQWNLAAATIQSKSNMPIS